MATLVFIIPAADTAGPSAMGRPCEEVIVISDQEEGEIIDSDFWCHSPEPDSVAPAVPPPLPALLPFSPVSLPKEEPPRRRRRYSALPPIYCYKYKDKYMRTRIAKRRLFPRTRLKSVSTRKKRQASSSTESEVDTASGDRAHLAIPKKSKPITSLRSRLSNMMKLPVRKRKSEESPPKDDLLENLSSDEELEAVKEAAKPSENSSDDDVDILRERALKSKCVKPDRKPRQEPNDGKANGSDVDDDETLQLRMAALKSAILKKAKTRVKKKHDKPIENEEEYRNYMFNVSDPLYLVEEETESVLENQIVHSEDVEEDEDILRSKLLASMKARVTPIASPAVRIDAVQKCSDSRLVVRLGGSDTESESEATKNLVVMHKKLTEQSEFQRNLDQYLKSARMVIADKAPSRVNSSRADSSMSPVRMLLMFFNLCVRKYVCCVSDNYFFRSINNM